MPIPFWKPGPAPPAALQAQRQPLHSANYLSQLFLQWLNPLLKIGYSRPIQMDDLWDVPEYLECAKAADQIEAALNARLPPSRRLAKYKPASNEVGSAGVAAENPSHRTQISQERIDYEENLFDGDDAQLANLRSTEFAEDLTLNPVDSRANRRGSEATVVSLAPDARRRPSRMPAADASTESPDQIIKLFGKRKGKKIATGQYAVENGVLYDMSFFRAVFSTMKKHWVLCLFLNSMSSALQVGAPLVSRQLISQISISNAFSNAEKNGSATSDLTRPRPLYHVCGLAVALFSMLIFSTLFRTHWYAQAGRYGILAQSATVDLIGRKSLRLSAKARLTQTNGRLNSMITVDTTYLKDMVPASTNLLVQPIVLMVGSGLLIWLLGYSAIVGVGIIVLAAAPVGKLFQMLLHNRQVQTKLMDKRIRLMAEVINSIRAVKLYAYESYMGQKVSAVREEEIVILRAYGVLRSTVNALIEFIPIVASVMTFVTYSLTGHSLEPATIFPALQFFTVISGAISLFPPDVSQMLDAHVAIGRLNTLLVAEELESHLNIDPQMKWGVRVRGDFQYDSSMSNEVADEAEGGDSKEKNTSKTEDAVVGEDKGAGASTQESEKAAETEPFALRNIDISIPRGALVCIVGRVGSGKSALFMGMINEMRRLHGEVCFGGKVSLVPQQAWVQSGTVRDNITFSTDSALVNDPRVQDVIRATGLQADLDMWQDGDMTLIGERGITLSGGQRQRICIARAAYDESEVVLLDDPLSAVDANVGHHLLHHCILDGPFAHRTRILVTHQLDVLPRADLILVMDRDDCNEGRIIQQGTYNELLQQEGVFQTLIQEYGSAAVSNSTSIEGEKEVQSKEKEHVPIADEDKQKGGKLVLDEERETGEIAWSTYLHYLRAIRAWWIIVVVVLILAWVEGSRVTTFLFLGFWSRMKYADLSEGAYMGIYAGVAASMAIADWLSYYMMIIAGNRASFAMFLDAWSRVMRSPTSWHDRTPTGRILSRMSKDVQQMDNWLAQNFNGYLQYCASVIGTFFLVTYSFPWLAFMFIPIIGFFLLTAAYYTRTNRETKRVESLLRSFVYSSLQEQLAGLPVIRAFGQQERSSLQMQTAIDNLNRAYYLMNSLTGWLNARLQCSSSVMVLGVGLYGAVARDTVNPAQFGVALSFVMASLAIFNNLVPLWVTCQQRMNSVERVQHYRELETEAAAQLPTDPKPDEPWPTAGAVSFENVQLRYRPDLPLVLKGLTFDVKPGEKVGIIGRTGAGKSSIAQALFRTVELCEGKIEVDGRDLRSLGLEVVRSRLAIIPQDAFLFGGTVRENIDPTGARTDAELNDAMGLVHRSSSSSAALKEKFSLDGIVANEGSNFSAGERQLLSLMRALARRCKVLLLDEATSSVDPETDALIQRIIQTEFADVTLISIAHRLQTVAFYDRILVMDAGRIAEFDTPLNLFDRPDSIFRSLCQKKALGREDLIRIQVEAERAAVGSAYPTPMPSGAPSLKE